MTEKTEQYIVNVTANAKNDLRNIISFISHNNPQTALKIFLSEICSITEVIEQLY